MSYRELAESVADGRACREPERLGGNGDLSVRGGTPAQWMILIVKIGTQSAQRGAEFAEKSLC